MTPPRLRILPVVGRDHRTVREPTTATVSATMTGNAVETRAGTVIGHVLRRLVARVDVTNEMAILGIREVDGTTGGKETRTRDMNNGREIRGMERKRIYLTNNARGNSGLERQMSVKTENTS